MPIKVRSSKTVYKTPFIEVNEADVELPNGKRKTYSNVIRRTAISVFALDKNKDLFLIKQYRYLFDKEIIETVAGYVNDEEDFLDAAKRELKEETGITAEKWTTLPVMEMGAGVVRMTQPMFLAQELQHGEQSLDEGEEIEIVKIALDRAIEMVESGEINQAGTSFGILLIDRMIREGKITV